MRKFKILGTVTVIFAFALTMFLTPKSAEATGTGTNSNTNTGQESPECITATATSSGSKLVGTSAVNCGSCTWIEYEATIIPNTNGGSPVITYEAVERNASATYASANCSLVNQSDLLPGDLVSNYSCERTYLVRLNCPEDQNPPSTDTN